MNTTKIVNRRVTFRRAFVVAAFAACLTMLEPCTDCFGQGTMTIRFEGPPYTGAPSPEPPGFITPITGYSESGMQFWNPSVPQTLSLVGPANSGYPDNGTAYLAVPVGANLEFSLSPVGVFNFVSFDAANYAGNPPSTLEVIGFKPQIMAPPIMVTNFFTTTFSFQTFHLDSQFLGVYQVEVLSDRWSLDNVVVSGVPEPSSAALIIIGSACVAIYRRVRQQSQRRSAEKGEPD